MQPQPIVAVRSAVTAFSRHARRRPIFAVFSYFVQQVMGCGLVVLGKPSRLPSQTGTVNGPALILDVHILQTTTDYEQKHTALSPRRPSPPQAISPPRRSYSVYLI
jgi:hypothetical protein